MMIVYHMHAKEVLLILKHFSR